METIKAIKPGPKPDKADRTPDKRRRVTPETKPRSPKSPNFAASSKKIILFTSSKSGDFPQQKIVDLIYF